MLTLALPYPPSINNYYGRVGSHGVRIKPSGVAYRRNVVGLVAAIPRQAFDAFHMGAALAVRVILNPPAGREAPDIDNGLKALLDALTHAKAWGDDRQIKSLLVDIAEPVDKGGATVLITLRKKIHVIFEQVRQ